MNALKNCWKRWQKSWFFILWFYLQYIYNLNIHPCLSSHRPCAAVVLVSLPSCPISVCPLRRVWLHADGCPLGCDSASFSSPVQILSITALAPLKSKFFVLSEKKKTSQWCMKLHVSWPPPRALTKWKTCVVLEISK